MYPRGELNRLAARKALLQARIALRRLECQVHARELARPVDFLGRAWALWRRIGPLGKMVGVPVGLWVAGKWLGRGGRAGKLAGWLKYAPLVFRAVRGFSPPREPATGQAPGG